LRYASALNPTMARANKLLDQILRGGADANIPFSGMVQLLKRLGFQERIKGSRVPQVALFYLGVLVFS
jgi:hypothetical protein